MVEIELKGIHFTYLGADEPTLRGLSLRLREGNCPPSSAPPGRERPQSLR